MERGPHRIPLLLPRPPTHTFFLLRSSCSLPQGARSPFTHCLATLIPLFRFPSLAVSSPPQHVSPRYPVLSQPFHANIEPLPSCPNHTAVFIGPRLAPAKDGSLPQSKSGCMKPPISKHHHYAPSHCFACSFVAVTPFELEGGGIVGVMQGWVPNKLDAAIAGQQQQQQRIVGVRKLMHHSPHASYVTRHTSHRF
jgi:hypothetical protein